MENRLLGMLLVCLCACDGVPDLRAHIFLRVDAEPRNYIAGYAVKAANQLGRTVSILPEGVRLSQSGLISSAVEVSIVDEIDCAPSIGAYVKWNSPYVMHLCPMPESKLPENIVHEWGHIMGMKDHLPCASGAIMSPASTCVTGDDTTYKPEDIEAICEFGNCFLPD